MPCNKFISIRLERKKPTRVYVDTMADPKHSLEDLTEFELASPLAMVAPSPQGALLRIEPMRWPSGQSYNSPMTFSLSARWPYGTKLCEEGDTASPGDGRSLAGVKFSYDQQTLSWSQTYGPTGVNLQGSIKLTKDVPVLYVTLEVKPKTQAQGRLIVDGADIT